MKSIKFPDMFNSSSTNIVSDFDATQQNLILLLGSEKGELFGDPYYGIRIKRYIYEQNNSILRDIIIDEIYTQIALFMPQLLVKRKDIKIIQNQNGKRAQIIATVKATNRIDFTTNLYNIVLFDSEENAV